MAITAIVLPSCNVSRKGGLGRGAGVEADSLSEEEAEARRAALWEEFGEEDYQPLPTGWNAPYQRRYRREQARLEREEARRRQAEEGAAADSITWEVPLKIVTSDSTASDSLSPSRIPEGDEVTTGPGEDIPVMPEGDAEAGDEGSDTSAEERQGNLKKVDYTGDLIRNIHITEDSTAINILGNVVFYHNGAVITCDSAVRFSERRMEFYKRVVINNGTTYVYGDRAEYNGEINIARVYSPMIKVVDEDAVLYTYNFVYNTLTEVGRYWGGGTLTHKDSQMESLRGYYDTETREFTGAGEVELTNPDYKMISDSVRYNLNTEVAEFFVPTRIWNTDGEILLADRGKYRSAADDYEFTKNSYILTETQEMWADSMRHFAGEDHTIFRRDIQIIDEDNNTMAFGDHGEYWGETEHGFLTLDPSLISFDTEEPDTVYMRSDSMFFFTYPYDHVFEGLGTNDSKTTDFEELLERPTIPDNLAVEDGEGESEIIAEGDSGEESDDESLSDDETGEEAAPTEGSPDEPGSVQLSKKEQRQARKAAKKSGRDIATARENVIEGQDDSQENEPEDDTEGLTPAEEIDIIESDQFESSMHSKRRDEQPRIVDRMPDGNEETKGDEAEEPEEIEEPRPEIYVSPYGELAEKLHRIVAADSLQQAMTPEEFWLSIQREIREDSVRMDHYYHAVDEALSSGNIDWEDTDIPEGGPEAIIETLTEESQRVAALLPAVTSSDEIQENDSVQRIFYGLRDVRIFRDDFQAVCDSIIGFSRDSTIHMHINPVMWSDQNQVVSDVMIIYTKDEELYKAEYYGNPFMSSEVDSLANQYNQIKGKFMTAWFRDNDIYRHDVFGNGQTHYYNEDSHTGEVDGFSIIVSTDITFLIDEQQIDEIIYRYDPDFIIYPIDMIPPDVNQILPGFTWEAHRRPRSKEDVFTRTIRTRRREEVTALPQPTFPLTDSINERKEQLTRDNIWRDRNDTLSPLALEFIRETELKYAEEVRNGQ